METLSTNNEKKSSRILALDIARLIAMLMMVQGHTIFALLEANTIKAGQWYWQLWTFTRGLTAPVFLMVSGAVQIFANKRLQSGKLSEKTIKRRFRTCIILLCVGYLLQFPTNNLYDLFFLNEQGLFNFLKVNVLQMFSISIFLLTLLYIITRNNFTLAIASFIIGNSILILTPKVLSINWFDILPIPLASFLSMKNGSIFPIFPFTAYLFLGTFVGYLIKKQEQEKRTFYIATRVAILGLIYVLIAYFLKYLNYHSVYNNSFIFTKSTLSIWLIVIRVGLSMIAISMAAWVCYFLEKFKQNTVWKSIQDTIYLFSNRALFIYVIHLLLIYGSPITPGLRHFLAHTDVFTAVYSAFAIIFFTMLIVYIYDKTFSKEKFSQLYKYAIVALLIYMLFI